MAGSAVLAGIVFFIEIAIMNIGMARSTGGTYLREGPPFIILAYMACKTGGSSMSTLQGKGTGLVLFEGIETIVKSLFQGMTGCAIR